MEQNYPYGLTAKEAAAKLKKEGPNELQGSEKKSLFKIILQTFREPMLVLLLLCALLYFPLGNIEDAVILLVAALVIIVITIFQERKTENTLQALKELATPQATVIRDGQETMIPRRDIVTEDVIVVREGQRIPADAIVVEARTITVDESILTGESVPVLKFSDGGGTQNIGDDKLYFGTMVVSGQAFARVFAKGKDTELGKIGASLSVIEREETGLDKEVKRLVKYLAFFGLGLCLLTVVIYGAFYNMWIKGLLSGFGLAMAMLPEEFPVVLTIFLSIGAYRIARKHVLARKTAAIEALGSATVLCADKTGTITKNQMEIKSIVTAGETIAWSRDEHLHETFHSILEYAMLASDKDPYDPMDKAIYEMFTRHLGGTDHVHTRWVLLKEYPLTVAQKSMAEAWADNESPGYITAAAKGAPEAILSLCGIKGEDADQLMKKVIKLAETGQRVLGVAGATVKADTPLQDQKDYPFHFLGFIGFEDPVRESALAAIQACHGAGIKVKLITGDYAATAVNIAGQAGLLHPERVISGEALARMDDAELEAHVEDANVFSRITPLQKLRLVNAMKASGEIVAMTGDGVNDAPALKSAHIGIAMGKRGTDIAREAASLILLEDDFSAIPEAVKLGRRIFANLQKALSYVFAIHIPIAGMAILPLFFKDMPMVLTPVHIVFLELIIDPACTLLFEAEEASKDIMLRPPRPLHTPLFSLYQMIISGLQGLGVLIAILAVYFYTASTGYSEADVRTITFATMISGNIFLILTNLSEKLIIFHRLRQNPMLKYMLPANLCLIAAVLYIPAVQRIFHFSIMHFNDLFIAIGAGLLSVLWFEIYKMARARKS